MHDTGTGKTRNEEMGMGNGKRRKWETGDEKMGIFLHNCIALFAFSNTSSGADFCHSREEVETIAYASA